MMSSRSITKFISVFVLVALLVLMMGIMPARANNIAVSFPFSQNWTNAGLITVNDDWSGVDSIIGYRGDNLITTTGVDPQTVLAGDDTTPVIDVIANQTNTGITNGGVAEFDGITNPTIALQGSATADAPYIKIFLDTTNANQMQISYNVRDIDVNDDAVQQVALQYRVGSSGNFTNIPGGYIADATTGPNLATLVTPVSLTLPAAVNQQTHVELRIITTDAAGFDEWVGIDDISITANYAPTG